MDQQLETTARARRRRVPDKCDFKWLERGKMAGMANPYYHGQPRGSLKGTLQWLFRTQKITTIVSLEQRGADKIKAAWTDIGGVWYGAFLCDWNAPSAIHLSEYVDLVDEQIQKRRKVVTHCIAGRGRTGTFLTAWYMKKNKCDAYNALKQVRSAMESNKLAEVAIQYNSLARYGDYIRKSRRLFNITESPKLVRPAIELGGFKDWDGFDKWDPGHDGDKRYVSVPGGDIYNVAVSEEGLWPGKPPRPNKRYYVSRDPEHPSAGHKLS